MYSTAFMWKPARNDPSSLLSDPGYRLEQADRSEVRVSISDPVTVVSSRWVGRGTYKGEAFKDDQRCGQTWLQTGRRWQLLSEHCVQITPASSD